MPPEETSGAPTTAAEPTTTASAAPADAADTASKTEAKATPEKSTRDLLEDITLPGDEPAKAKTPEPGKTDEEEASDEDGNADDAPDLKDLEGYEFVKRVDPELLREPTIVEYLKQQEDGHRKLISQAKAEKERMGNWASWADALGDPETAADAYEQLGEGLRKAGILKGAKAPAKAAASAPDTFDWTEHFESEEDYKAFQRAADATYGSKIAELEAKLAKFEESQSKAEQNQQASRNEALYKSWLSENSPVIIERLQRDESGWTVTPEMVDEAVRSFPEIAKTDPVRAVKLYHSDARAAHIAAAARGSATKAPEMPETAANEVTSSPITSEMSSREILDRLSTA